TLYEGELVEYMGDTWFYHSIPWYYIYYDTDDRGAGYGYVMSQHLWNYDNTGASLFWVVADERADVHSGPGFGYEVVRTLEVGEHAFYLGETRYDNRGVPWYEVRIRTNEYGWVSSQYTELISGAHDTGEDILPPEDGEDTAPGEGGVYLEATGDVNIRSGPGLGYRVLGTMRRGNYALYLNAQETDARGVIWYEVSFEGDIGWVSSRYSEFVYGDAGEDAAPHDEGDDDMPPGEGGNYVVATGSVNLRSGPGLSYDDVGTMREGDRLPYEHSLIVDARGVVWYKVSFRGGSAWVSSRYSELQMAH
ncbi:MAG: SH3 domain-containing protein, partial [Clostridiales bacterium]|nr:SH3 domain-containing protein [Clostridiales bacterium]